MEQYTLAQLSPVIQAPLQRHVLVCTGKSCSANNSEAVLEAFKTQLKDQGALYKKHDCPQGNVLVTHCGSVGLCKTGPAVMVYPEGVWYARVTVADVPELIARHLQQGQPVTRLQVKQLS